MPVLTSFVIDRVVRKTRRNTITTFLDGLIDNVQTTVIAGAVTFISVPAMIEVDSELMMVTDVDVPNRVLTVLRGHLGTVAAAHADRAPMFAAPEFLRQDMFDLVNECLDNLYPDLYRFNSVEITGSSDIGYELPLNSPKPLSVWAKIGTRDKSWKPVGDWEFIDHADPTDFPNGSAISIRANVGASKIRVTMPMPFARVVTEADDLEAVAGLQTYMTDLPYYYTMAYVLGERENSRSQVIAGQTHQRAQDVPPFSAMQAANWYRARYDQKKLESAIRLSKEVRRIIRTGYGS